MDIAKIINELGEDREHYLNSVSPPIFQTAMFASNTVADMRELLKREADEPFYTRGNNPTTDILRKKVAALEGAEDALIFASGSAAVAAAVMVNLQQGDHIVSVKKPYSWTNKLFTTFLPRFGIETTFVDGTDAENYRNAIQKNTKLFYLESPNSWTFEQQDIQAVAKIAQENQIKTVMDNSWATPLYQNPIKMGVDFVIHSATKYMAGHSDIVAGVLCASKAEVRKVFASEYMTMGGIISPMNAWLLLRGLRTLALRLEHTSQSTQKIVEFLANHPKIKSLHYPFLESDPQYDLAKQQMKKGTGMFSIRVKAEEISQVEDFCNHLQRFLLAVSWGSYESLIFPACTLYASEIYKSPDLPWDMIRVSVGLEDAEDLIQDFSQALDHLP